MRDKALPLLAATAFLVYIGGCMPIGFVEGSGTSYYCSKGHENEYLNYPMTSAPLPLIQNPNNGTSFRVLDGDKGFYMYFYRSEYIPASKFSWDWWRSSSEEYFLADIEYYTQLQGIIVEPVLKPFGFWANLWHGNDPMRERRTLRFGAVCWNEDTGYACCSATVFLVYDKTRREKT